MYNIDFKKITGGYKVGLIFLIFGFIFLLAFGYMVFNTKIKKNSLDSWIMSREVTEDCYLDDEGYKKCGPEYHYLVNGNEYVCPPNSYSTGSVDFTNKIVYYDSAKPDKCINEYDLNTNKWIIYIMILPIICLVVGFVIIIKTKIRVNKAKVLCEKGTLIEGVDYRLEKTGMVYKNREIMRMVVECQLPTGYTILKGSPIYDEKERPLSGKADVLIDLNDPSNYYIDMNITRKI